MINLLQAAAWIWTFSLNLCELLHVCRSFPETFEPLVLHNRLEEQQWLLPHFARLKLGIYVNFRVNFHVGSQITALSEIFSTYFAGVWSLPRVDSSVDMQMAFLNKTFPTRLTGVALVIQVISQVDVQMTTLHKLFPTYFTGIRLLTCVSSHVNQ